MNKLALLIISLMITSSVYVQNNDLQALISQGVQLHDAGQYKEAIAKYKEALAIDSKSDIVNYEIAYSYFANKQYDEAINYSNLVVKGKSKFQEEAYMVLGNSYDLSGEYSKAVKSYQKGLSKFPKSNLLHYNLALTYFNNKDLKKAEKSGIEAVKSKPRHASSHLLLSVIMDRQGKRVQSLLPAYYFLMLEPNSKRSLIYYDILLGQLGKGVERTDAKSINISISPNGLDDEFGAAELMVSMYAAKRYTDEDSTKNDYVLFAETNKDIFNLLESLKKGNKGFWWEFYVDTFADLVKTNNDEAFSYYISKSKNDEIVNTWMQANTDKLHDFEVWLNR